MVGHFLAFILEMYYYILNFILFSFLLYLTSEKILFGHEKRKSPPGAHVQGGQPVSHLIVLFKSEVDSNRNPFKSSLYGRNYL